MKISFVAAALALLWAVPASAQIPMGESPRNGAIKAKLGGYNPRAAIDAGLEAKPYESTFGTSGMLLFELTYDRYLYKGIGSFGLGLTAGYAEKYGRAQAGGEDSAVPTALRVYPLRLDALYNFDYASRQWGIPLVPYARLGLAYVPWRITKGEDVEVFDGQRAQGGRWGFGYTAGLAFLLDVLDPRLARDFDSGVGVNHTYLFGEYSGLQANGFGSPGIDLSSRYWTFGLAFEI